MPFLVIIVLIGERAAFGRGVGNKKANKIRIPSRDANNTSSTRHMHQDIYFKHIIIKLVENQVYFYSYLSVELLVLAGSQKKASPLTH